MPTEIRIKTKQYYNIMDEDIFSKYFFFISQIVDLAQLGQINRVEKSFLNLNLKKVKVPVLGPILHIFRALIQAPN